MKASTPRRKTKTRKAPVESHSPAKGGARKKKSTSTSKSKSKTNDESLGSGSNGSVASLASSGDDIEVMSATSIGSINSNDKLYKAFLMEVASKDIDLSDSEDDSGDDTFNPRSDTNEDEDVSSVYSFDDAASCDEDSDDDINPTTTVTVTVDVLPKSKFSKPTNVKDKGTGENAPTLTPAFKGLGFYTKDTVSKYNIDSEDIAMIKKMNSNKPIIPIDTNVLDLERRLSELCSCYERSIKSAKTDTEAEQVGSALEETRLLLCQLRESLAKAKDDCRKVESVRSMAKRAVDYWAPIDAQKLIAWQKVFIKTNTLLELCDEHKKQQDLQRSKMKSAHEAATKAKLKAASNAKAKANAPVELVTPLVKTADGSMKEVSECIVLPPDARSPRVVKKIKGTKEKKQHKPITPEQFNAVINGGRGGDGPKLHNHGLWLDKDGIAHCSLCNATIELLKSLKRHTVESKKHNALYQKKMAGALKLHQQSVKLVDKEAKGSELSDDLKAYRFKALIAAAKHNVPTEAMKGLCADFVDEYSGHTFADSSDVVSLAAKLYWILSCYVSVKS